jgi:hypothetical protein
VFTIFAMPRSRPSRPTGASPIAVGHRSMVTTMPSISRGVVLRNEADTLAERVLGVQDPGTNTLESALVREEA